MKVMTDSIPEAAPIRTAATRRYQDTGRLISAIPDKRNGLVAFSAGNPAVDDRPSCERQWCRDGFRGTDRPGLVAPVRRLVVVGRAVVPRRGVRRRRRIIRIGRRIAISVAIPVRGIIRIAIGTGAERAAERE